MIFYDVQRTSDLSNNAVGNSTAVENKWSATDHVFTFTVFCTFLLSFFHQQSNVTIHFSLQVWTNPAPCIALRLLWLLANVEASGPIGPRWSFPSLGVFKVAIFIGSNILNTFNLLYSSKNSLHYNTNFTYLSIRHSRSIIPL